MKRKVASDPSLVVGYARVSTTEQGDSGAGLEAQRRVIRAEVERRGWTLVALLEDVASGGKIDGRPGLAEAMGLLRSGDAGTLMSAKLDRLSRSTLDFGNILADCRRMGRNLVVLDLGLDLSTPMGEAMATMAAMFAQLERRMISDRTKAALAVKKSQGVRLGRRRMVPDDVVTRIRAMREAGKFPTEIAATLTAEGVPTAGGGRRWWPNTVHKMLRAA